MKTHRLNQVILIGNAGKDGEVKELSGDKRVANVSIATEDGYWDKNKSEFVKRPNWHRIEGFGWAADKIGKIHKGDSVLVCGSLEYNKWENEQGEKQSMAVVKVKNSADISIISSEPQNNNTQDDYFPQGEKEPFDDNVDEDLGLPF
jgi:single-strand DNA-binding protein